MRISDWSSDVCSSDLFDFYADLIERLPEVERRERPAGDAYTVMVPVGVVAAILPWKAPLNLRTLNVPPALAAVSRVIPNVAPSTPPAALTFVESLDAAGPSA